MVTTGKIIEPGRAPLKRPVFGGEGRAVGEFLWVIGWIAVVNFDPKAESFLGIDLTKSMQGTAAGTVDHPLGAARLWTEIVGFGQGAVAAHATAKEKGFNQVFTKGVQAAALFSLISLETDCSGQGENKALLLEGGIMDSPVDPKKSRWFMRGLFLLP